MKVLHGEGVANHTGPESCAGAGDRTREALTGVRAGRVLSREKGTPWEITGRLERRRPGMRRKATLRGPLTRGARGLCAVVAPEHVRTHLVRKPGDPTVVWGNRPDRTGNLKGARR
jgi:hypothetical protein